MYLILIIGKMPIREAKGREKMDSGKYSCGLVKSRNTYTPSQRLKHRSVSPGTTTRITVRSAQSARCVDSARSVCSVHDTFMRAESARQSYLPDTPRLPANPISARELLHHLESANRGHRNTRTRPLTARELTNREKVKHLEYSILKNPEFANIRPSTTNSISTSTFASSSLTAPRMKLPKIMPCLRPNGVILAQAEQRIARGVIVKEVQVLQIDDTKRLLEQKRIARERKLARMREMANAKSAQMFLLQTMELSLSTMLFMRTVVASRHEEMLKNEVLMGTSDKKKTANSTRWRRSSCNRRGGAGGDTTGSTSSAFITNPDGTQDCVLGEEGDHSDEYFSDNSEGSGDDCHVLDKGRSSNRRSSQRGCGLSDELFENMYAQYQSFLHLIRKKKWQLLLALSIIRKRCAVRIIRASIPAMATQPKVTVTL